MARSKYQLTQWADAKFVKHPPFVLLAVDGPLNDLTLAHDDSAWHPQFMQPTHYFIDHSYNEGKRNTRHTGTAPYLNSDLDYFIPYRYQWDLVLKILLANKINFSLASQRIHAEEIGRSLHAAMEYFFSSKVFDALQRNTRELQTKLAEHEGEATNTTKNLILDKALEAFNVTMNQLYLVDDSNHDKVPTEQHGASFFQFSKARNFHYQKDNAELINLLLTFLSPECIVCSIEEQQSSAEIKRQLLFHPLLLKKLYEETYVKNLKNGADFDTSIESIQAQSPALSAMLSMMHAFKLAKKGETVAAEKVFECFTKWLKEQNISANKELIHNLQLNFPFEATNRYFGFYNALAEEISTEKPLSTLADILKRAKETDSIITSQDIEVLVMALENRLIAITNHDETHSLCQHVIQILQAETDPSQLKQGIQELSAIFTGADFTPNPNWEAIFQHFLTTRQQHLSKTLNQLQNRSLIIDATESTSLTENVYDEDSIFHQLSLTLDTYFENHRLQTSNLQNITNFLLRYSNSDFSIINFVALLQNAPNMLRNCLIETLVTHTKLLNEFQQEELRGLLATEAPTQTAAENIDSLPHLHVQYDEHGRVIPQLQMDTYWVKNQQKRLDGKVLEVTPHIDPYNTFYLTKHQYVADSSAKTQSEADAARNIISYDGQPSADIFSDKLSPTLKIYFDNFLFNQFYDVVGFGKHYFQAFMPIVDTRKKSILPLGMYLNQIIDLTSQSRNITVQSITQKHFSVKVQVGDCSYNFEVMDHNADNETSMKNIEVRYQPNNSLLLSKEAFANTCFPDSTDTYTLFWQHFGNTRVFDKYIHYRFETLVSPPKNIQNGVFYFYRDPQDENNLKYAVRKNDKLICKVIGKDNPALSSYTPPDELTPNQKEALTLLMLSEGCYTQAYPIDVNDLTALSMAIQMKYKVDHGTDFVPNLVTLTNLLSELAYVNQATLKQIVLGFQPLLNTQKIVSQATWQNVITHACDTIAALRTVSDAIETSSTIRKTIVTSPVLMNQSSSKEGQKVRTAIAHRVIAAAPEAVPIDAQIKGVATRAQLAREVLQATVISNTTWGDVARAFGQKGFFSVLGNRLKRAFTSVPHYQLSAKNLEAYLISNPDEYENIIRVKSLRESLKYTNPEILGSLSLYVDFRKNFGKDKSAEEQARVLLDYSAEYFKLRNALRPKSNRAVIGKNPVVTALQVLSTEQLEKLHQKVISEIFNEKISKMQISELIPQLDALALILDAQRKNQTEISNTLCSCIVKLASENKLSIQDLSKHSRDHHLVSHSFQGTRAVIALVDSIRETLISLQKLKNIPQALQNLNTLFSQKEPSFVHRMFQALIPRGLVLSVVLNKEKLIQIARTLLSDNHTSQETREGFKILCDGLMCNEEILNQAPTTSIDTMQRDSLSEEPRADAARPAQQESSSPPVKPDDNIPTVMADAQTVARTLTARFSLGTKEEGSEPIPTVQFGKTEEEGSEHIPTVPLKL